MSCPTVNAGDDPVPPRVSSVGPADADLPGVQYLRGLAALIVVIYHLSLQWVKIAPQSEPYWTLQSGVDVFFLISGFVMVYSTRAGARLTASEFLLHRIVRVAPLYWAVTIATAGIVLFVPAAASTIVLDGGLVLASLFFIPYPNPASHDLSPLVLVGWTLNYEMFFYVVFAFGIWAGGRASRRVMTVVLSALGALVLGGALLRLPAVATIYTSPLLMEFALGMVLALLPGGRRLPPAVSLIVAAVGLLWLLGPPHGSPAMRVARYGPPAFLLLLAGIQSAWRRSALLHRLGDMSYSLYLSHFILLSAYTAAWRRLHWGAAPADKILFFAAGASIALAAGYVCWRWVERPLTRLAKRSTAGLTTSMSAARPS